MLLAAGTDNGVLVVRWTGEAWTLLAHGLYGQQIVDLTPAGGGGAYACAANGKVYRTRDWEQWEVLYEGLTGNGVHAIATGAGGDEQLLFAGTSPPLVFLSTNLGRSWSALPGFTKVSGKDGWTCSTPPYGPRVCRLIHLASGVLLAGIEEGGLLLSPDSGRRWAERWTGLPAAVNDMAVHPGQPQLILATTQLGLFRSQDLGGSWTPLKSGIPYPLTRGVRVDPDDSQRILVVVAKTPQSGAALVRSLDGGQSWEVVNRGLPPLKEELFSAILCTPGWQFAATSKGQIFWSRDFGELWVKVGLSFPAVRSLLVS